MLQFGGYLLQFRLASDWLRKNKHSRNFLSCSWFYGKDCKPGLAKIIAHLTNSSPFKRCFYNQPIRFSGSNLDSGEINGNVIGLEHSKDLTAWARSLLPTSTTCFDAPLHWRARRPLASRVAALSMLHHNIGRYSFYLPFTKKWVAFLD